MTVAEILQWGAVCGAIGAALSLWTRIRKGATEVAVWRTRTDMKIEGLEARLEAHKADHEGEAAKADAFRADMYAFIRETRERLTKIETRLESK